MDVFSIVFMYINQGIEHILSGFDHLLFILALIIISEKFMDVVKIVTAFTIAHSITLFLATLNIIPVYPKWVEAGIAFTICYVAIENFIVRDAKWRWLLTFLFGLIHGIGFATSIAEIGFSRSYLITSLVSFNLGIEIGQLAVVGIILPFMLKLRKRTTVYQYVFRILSAIIFVIGAYWFVERVIAGIMQP